MCARGLFPVIVAVEWNFRRYDASGISVIVRADESRRRQASNFPSCIITERQCQRIPIKYLVLHTFYERVEFPEIATSLKLSGPRKMDTFEVDIGDFLTIHTDVPSDRPIQHSRTLTQTANHTLKQNKHRLFRGIVVVCVIELFFFKSMFFLIFHFFHVTHTLYELDILSV